MARFLQARAVGVLGVTIGILPMVTLALTWAPALGEPPQTDSTAGAVVRDEGGGPARLIVRLKPGAEIRVVGGVAEVLGPTGGDGDRARVVLEGFFARRVQALFDMSTIGNPALAREIGLDRYYVVLPSQPTYRTETAYIGVSGIESLVEYIRFDIRRRVHWTDADSIPVLGVNDPEFGQQWALENTGQEICGVAGVPDADIGALYSWMLVGETEEVTVAVLDAGVSDTHPDLIGQLVDGANFSDGDMDAWQHGFNDHGTRVSGVISAVYDNGLGMAGVTRGAKIMPVRVLNDLNIAFPSDAAPGVVWAADNGADILNMSFGWPLDVLGGVEALRDAVVYAHMSGCLLVASSGNSPLIDVLYPAAFPEVMAVTATNNRDELWGNSTTGPEISVSAPGVKVLATTANPFQPSELYAFETGTSFAAPHVAGAAAVIWGEYPQLTNDEVREILELSAVDLGEPGFDESFGHGRLDLLNALLGIDPSGNYAQVTCLGDYDADGDIDLNDLFIFLSRFSDENPNVDLAPPYGVIDFFDVIEFLIRFGLGCFDDDPSI